MTESAEGMLLVLLFASLRDQAGWAERRLPLPVDSRLTARDVWNQLELGPLTASVRVALNQAMVDPDHRVQAGDELAFLPPFTGG